MAVEPAETLDVALLQRIVARDQTAVAELYDRHSAVMFSVILRILRNSSDAEEVLQEVFVRVWSRAATYDQRLGAPGAWLTRMARNRAIDRLRAKRTRSDVDAPEAIDAGDERTPASTVTSERIATDKQRTATVRAALQVLPEEQRTLITAAFFDGYTHQRPRQDHHARRRRSADRRRHRGTCRGVRTLERPIMALIWPDSLHVGSR